MGSSSGAFFRGGSNYIGADFHGAEDAKLPQVIGIDWGSHTLHLHDADLKSLDKIIAGLTAARERLVKRLEDDAAAKDAANRTPDADLDPSEREDQPEEVEKNRVLEQWEERQKAADEAETIAALDFGKTAEQHLRS